MMYQQLRNVSPFFSLFLLLMLPACQQTGDQSETDDAPRPIEEFKGQEWSATLDFEIGAPDDSLLFGYIGHVIVAENGHIYASDPITSHVYEFNEDGQLVRRLGSRGDGPGEFQYINGLAVTQDSLYVYDAQTRRLSVFGNTGSDVQRTVMVGALPSDGSPRMLLGTTTSGLLFSFSVGYSSTDLEEEKHIPVAEVSLSGRPSTPIHSVVDAERLIRSSDSGFSVATMPFGRQTHLAVGGDYLLAVSNKDLTYRLINTSDHALQEVTLPFTWDLPVTDDDLSSRLVQYGLPVEDLSPDELASIPRDWPIVDNAVLTNEPSVWLQLSTPRESGSTLFWQLDKSGQELAQLRLDGKVIVHQVENGRLYGAKYQDGAFSIVQYSIDKD